MENVKNGFHDYTSECKLVIFTVTVWEHLSGAAGALGRGAAEGRRPRKNLPPPPPHPPSVQVYTHLLCYVNFSRRARERERERDGEIRRENFLFPQLNEI